MSFVDTFDITAPAGSQALSLGDDRIRELKRALQERLNVDLSFPLSGNLVDGTLVGYHNKSTYICQGSDPLAVASAIIIYSKLVSGVCELHARISDGTIIQLTTGGYLNLAALNIAGQATGDLLYFDGANWTNLAIGSEGQGLGVASGIPAWGGVPSLAGFTQVSDTDSTDQTTSSSSYTDTSLSITFTPSKAGIFMAFFTGVDESSVGGNHVFSYALTFDSTVKTEIACDKDAAIDSDSLKMPLAMFYSEHITAAEHTIKVQFKRSGGTCRMAGATATSRLYVMHL